MRNAIVIAVCAFVIVTLYFICRSDNGNTIRMMATTTTRDSGLLSHLISELEKDTGLSVSIVAFGTGKVLRSAMDGNADIILVHDGVAEEEFMKAGYGAERYPLMQNDFVIVGPADDPANIHSYSSAIEAFQKIFTSGSKFASRGDESGTHKAELRILESAKINPDTLSTDQYIITGSGMGSTLSIAAEKSAYILTDYATWISFKNKGNLKILFNNDPLLTNIYSVITVNSALFDHISVKKQILTINWFKSAKAAKTINNFHISGKPAFKALIHQK